jgi:hypothetical protein
MASCQNLGAQQVLNSYDMRTEIVYSNDITIETQVSKIIKLASQTRRMKMVRAEIN